MIESEIVAHLTDGRTSLVLSGDGGMPEVVHWGSALGGRSIDPLMFDRPVVGGGLDVVAPVGVVAEASRGWFGRPGIEGSRSGVDFAPRFRTRTLETTGRSARIDLVDDEARLQIEMALELDDAGVLRIDAVLWNRGDVEYSLEALRVSLPIPGDAEELLMLGGRHAFEFVEHRSPWHDSVVVVENRHGKTGHERFPAAFAGTLGFGEHHGEVWAIHIGWSGNYEIVCDAVTDGRKVVQAGELLLPGEIVLEPGDRYDMPSVFCSYSGDGLNRISNQFHGHLRARRVHPPPRRPVILNTWEAVYFNHDLDALKALADLASEVGIDRFVLDDGWFGGRRDDTRGLGDWSVSHEMWPAGLAPLIEHVRSLGMDFGIWFEPEMVNEDSELYRTHPDWVLADRRYPLVTGRNQLVLDLGRPEVVAYLFESIDAILSEYDIAYVKWDHNRDLTSPASAGRPGVHRQTRGLYALLDRLRTAHPDVDFESCASGGGRVDFGILERTNRVWTSDSNDALDRHAIQRGFSLLFPPELMGTHIGAGVTHVTGRRFRLGFRAVAAFFGSLGVEWDLRQASDTELEQLTALIALHKQHARLLHTGTVVRTDHPDPTVEIHGVVATDRSEALFAVTRLSSGVTHHTPSFRVPGLDPDTTYTVALMKEIPEPLGMARRQPGWLTSGLIADGRQLDGAGFVLPQLQTESSILLHFSAIERSES